MLGLPITHAFAEGFGALAIVLSFFVIRNVPACVENAPAGGGHSGRLSGERPG